MSSVCQPTGQNESKARTEECAEVKSEETVAEAAKGTCGIGTVVDLDRTMHHTRPEECIDRTKKCTIKAKLGVSVCLSSSLCSLNSSCRDGGTK
jgi:hypothetical protein